MKKRGKSRIGKCLTLIDSYKEYSKQYSNEDPLKVDYKTYREICSLGNKKIMDYIIENAEELKLPFNLGYIHIQKKKMNLTNLENKLKVDWKRTNESGVRVYHLNEHSNGYRYAFKWTKETCKVKNKKAYCLIINRANKRRLAANIKAGKDYFE